MNAMAHMVNEQARRATHRQHPVSKYPQQAPAKQHLGSVQIPTSPVPQPTQHVQAQVQQPFVPHQVTPQDVDRSAQIADVMRNQFGLKP